LEYQCSAKTKDGRRVNRLLTAESPAAVIAQLRGEGLLPIKINQKAGSNGNGKTKKKWLGLEAGRVRPKELAVFTRQLGVTLTAGLLLTEALEAISDDLENEYFRKMILKIRMDVHGGMDLSAALAKYPKIFAPTYRAIVKVGEATGRLYKTLTNLAKYLEDTERLKEKVKSAVRYPLFVMCFAALVMFIMVFFLIPQFASMFSDFHAELPLLTRMVVAFSNFCVSHVGLCLAVLFALWLTYLYLKRYRKFQYILDFLKIKVPIIGKNIIHKSLLSAYCRTLGFMLSAGVNLKTSLEVTSQVVNHLLMSQAIDHINRRVVAGGTLSEEMRRQKIFTGLSAKMTSVGERTGRLSDMLERTSQYYEDELEVTLNNLTTMLEPALIIFVGANVLIVVLALYLPIFHLSTAIR
jgi:type IV pilus assembly protein PilC